MFEIIKTDKNNRGAGYVIAGLIKGLGIRYFEEYGVLEFLKEETKDVKKVDKCLGCI
jgi:hypothetical protein